MKRRKLKPPARIAAFQTRGKGVLEWTHGIAPRFLCSMAKPWNPEEHGPFAVHPHAVPKSKDLGSVWFLCPYCRTRFQMVAV